MVMMVMGVARVWLAPLGGEAVGATREEEKHMRQKRMQRILMNLGLGAVLVVSVGSWSVAGAASPTAVQPHTGQVREIKIDQCGLEPGTCAGSLVLAQARGQEVDLAIPAGTLIQRGIERVHLEELGVGNYVMVQATPLPREAGNPLGFGLDEVPRDGNRVGTSPGERPYTLHESSEE
jgi:hypothetical protein